jgi:hypothetical protein
VAGSRGGTEDAGRAGAGGVGADAAAGRDGGVADSARDGGQDAAADGARSDSAGGRDAGADTPRTSDAGVETRPPADAAAPVDGPAAADPEPGRLAGITRLHNVVRAEIPVPPLVWDPQIAATAQAYAARCQWRHSGAAGLGENLAAFAPPGRQTAAAPVDGWAAEKADYNYATNSCAAGKQCGHYTQMVWRTSTRVGCGVQICSQGSPFEGVTNWEIWVCNYAPPGNIVGQRPY